MSRRNHLANGKFGDGGERVRLELERGRTGPGAFHCDVLKPIVDKLEDPVTAVDMRNDLEEIVRLGHARSYRLKIQCLVLETHGSSGDAHWAIVECADQRILVDAKRRLRVFLGESPQLAAAIDGRTVIQEHGVRVAALLALELHR